jgi:hypothetical protein
VQTPMPPSVVSLPTCSSPTTSVTMFARRTQVSASVCSTTSPLRLLHLLIHTTGQVGKVLGDRWKALSEKDRQPYEKKAAADKKRYEDEKAKYAVSEAQITFNKNHTDSSTRLAPRRRSLSRCSTRQVTVRLGSFHRDTKMLLRLVAA